MIDGLAYWKKSKSIDRPVVKGRASWSTANVASKSDVSVRRNTPLPAGSPPLGMPVCPVGHPGTGVPEVLVPAVKQGNVVSGVLSAPRVPPATQWLFVTDAPVNASEIRGIWPAPALPGHNSATTTASTAIGAQILRHVPIPRPISARAIRLIFLLPVKPAAGYG